jgi:hypothetical protein
MVLCNNSENIFLKNLNILDSKNRTQLQIGYDSFQNLNVGYFNSRERDPSIQ